MQHSHQTYASSVPDAPGSVSGSATVQTTLSPLNSNCSSGHYYHRAGISVPQQSPGFNSLISGQGQSLYNGVYSSQTGFQNQNAFSPATFSACIETPVWFTDTRASVSSSNNVPLIESDRGSRNQYIDKNMSCCSSRIGVLENISMCSPLSSDTFKLQSKNSSMIDSPNWQCSQGVSSYANQPNQHSSNQMPNFKCNEQFSSCSVSQINVLLPEQNDLKHSSNINVENSCLLSPAPNQMNGNALNKQIGCESNSLKSGYLNKELLSKYSCSVQKSEEPVVHSSAMHTKHVIGLQDQGAYGNVTTMYTATSSDAHDYGVYPQAVHRHINNLGINDSIQSTRKHLGVPPHQNNHAGQFPIFQQHFHDTGMPCDAIENCSQTDSKIAKLGNNIQCMPTGNNCTCCSLSASCDQHMFSNSLMSYTQRQSVCCLSESAAQTTQQLCSNVTTQLECSQNEIAHLKIDCKADELKENTNEGSSVAGESDIIVEETEEETESEISIEENKFEDCVQCLVCDTIAITRRRGKFTRMNCDMPTTTSNIPVALKLAEIIPSSKSLFSGSDNNRYICRICLSLTDSIDSLEIKLASVKQDLILRYSRKEVITSKITLDKAKSCTYLENKAKDLLPKDKYISDIGNKRLCEKIAMNNDDSSLIQGKTKYQCVICTKYFASKEYLAKHGQIHTKDFSFYCKLCGRGFMLRRVLENHILVHNGDSHYQCEVCGKLFIQRFNLETHLRKHNEDYRVSCTMCGKGFMTKNSLQIHLRTHSRDKPFVCQHCGRKFATCSNLTSHVRVCSGETSFSCDKCDMKFALKSELRNHILSSHDGSYRCKCAICDKGFMKDSDCKAHMVTHTMEKKYKCLICGKCYSNLGNLNQHSRNHDEERPFKCTLCNQGFLRKCALTNHMNQHDGLRPFTCKQCGKMFTSHRNLQAHLKWHAGTLKRYMCNICGKSFKHGLKVHMRTHSGIKPYKCPKCALTFTVKSSVDKHFKLKHGMES